MYFIEMQIKKSSILFHFVIIYITSDNNFSYTSFQKFKKISSLKKVNYFLKTYHQGQKADSVRSSLESKTGGKHF